MAKPKRKNAAPSARVALLKRALQELTYKEMTTVAGELQDMMSGNSLEVLMICDALAYFADE